MNKTKVVHRGKERYDVYIGRPGPFGNPFKTGQDGTKDEVIAKYKAWVLSSPERLQELETLRGKVLGCWCKPSKCHGDAIVEILHPENTLENYFTS